MRKENKNCRRQAAKTRQPINACSSREMKIRRIFMVLPRSECARGRHRRERALEPPPIRVMMIRNPRKRFAPTHQRATSQPNNQGDSKSHTFQDSLETCNQREDQRRRHGRKEWNVMMGFPQLPVAEPLHLVISKDSLWSSRYKRERGVW